MQRPARSLLRIGSVMGLALSSTLTLAGCDEKEAKENASKAWDATKDAADKGADWVKEKHESGELERGAKKAWDGTKDVASDAAGWVRQKHDSGELGEESRKALEAAGEGISWTVAKGKQVAPVAKEVSATLADAYDRDIDIDPIYQDIDDEAALDAEIGGMPRRETIDGVEVGFKELSETDASRTTSSSAYLVVWRQGDKLVGFVYRSRKSVDMDVLVKETPRLIKLVKSVL